MWLIGIWELCRGVTVFEGCLQMKIVRGLRTNKSCLRVVLSRGARGLWRLWLPVPELCSGPQAWRVGAVADVTVARFLSPSCCLVPGSTGQKVRVYRYLRFAFILSSLDINDLRKLLHTGTGIKLKQKNYHVAIITWKCRKILPRQNFL